MVTTPMPTILGNYPDFLSPNFVDHQNKLREKCEASLLNDIVRHGKKSEEIYWTKVYHEPMQVYKKLKRSGKSGDVKSLQLHFIAGIGFYMNIVKRLFAEYNLDNQFNLATLVKEMRFCEIDGPEKQKRISFEEKEAVSLCVHAIFIHVGDLFRYLDTLGYPQSKSAAIKWYHGAIVFQPSIGMPYNQLGTLFTGYNYGLDSAYYYMRCLLSDKPFTGAEGNLKAILIACPKYLPDESKEDQACKENDAIFVVKKCIIQLMIIADEFNNSQSRRQSKIRITAIIQDFLTTLTTALELPPAPTNFQKPTYLDSSIIFKMGTMCLMFLSQLQVNLIDNGIFYSAAIALALNFLLLNVNAFIARFKGKIGELNSPSSPKPTTVANGKAENSQTNNRPSKANTPDLSPRRALSRLRRRKAAITYDDIDTNLLDFEDDSELSEAEETALSTFDALDIGSDISENGSVCDEEYVIKSSDDDDQLNSHNLQEPCGLSQSADIDVILKYLYYETSLPTLKTLCDWLRVDHELVSYSIQSVDGLFTQFTEMLTILKDIETRALSSNSKLERLKCTGPNWRQKYPLTSDLSLLKFKLFEKIHSTLYECETLNENLSPVEMGFLCVECIIGFGEFLTNNIVNNLNKGRSTSSKFKHV